MIRRPPRSTQSRSSAASDVYKRQGGECDLASLVGGGDDEQADDCATGVSWWQGGVEGGPSPGVSGPREQGFAVDEISDGLRLAAQRSDQMAIIDGMGSGAIGTHARHGHDEVRAVEAVQPIVEEVDLEGVSDEP